MKNKKQHAIPWAALLCGAVFLWMLLLNLLTPYLADDFPFSYNFGNRQAPLTSLSQLLSGLAFHYMEWSGRIIVKFFAQGFTMLPKVVFDICNAGMFTLLGILLCAAARPGKPSFKLLAAAYLGLWHFSPVFGQTNLWMCGSCNYLWATVGCMAYLLVWLRYLEKPFAAGKLLPLWMGLGGFVAGALSENTSAGMLAGLVLVIAALLLLKRRPPLWMLTGLVGALVGFAFLILAPGNSNRKDVGVDTRTPLTRLAVRLLTCCDMLERYALPLLAVILLLGAAVWFQRQDWKVLLVPAILLVSGVAANFAMVGSPVYYERSTHGVLTLLVACAVALLARLDTLKWKQLTAALLLVTCLPTAFSMVYAGYDVASFWMMDRQRTQLIQDEIADGNREVITYAIACYTPYCGAYGLPDIRTDSGDSIGLMRSWKLGAISIVADEVHTYPFPGRVPAYDEDMLPLLDEAQLAELNR